MKTNIKFPSRSADVEREVIEIVEKAFGCQATNREIRDATAAVTEAFNDAGGMAGNGSGSSSWAFKGEFYAVASVSTGEFDLYKKII